jgi:hypothetical protein
MHRRAHFKKNFSKQDLNQGIMLCRTCHAGIHKRFDEMQLAKTLNTLATIKQNPELEKFFSWVSKQRLQHS